MRNPCEIRKIPIEDWPNSDIWKAIRLAFLWSFRDYNSIVFRDNNLDEEVAEFNFADEFNVREIANSYDPKVFSKILSSHSMSRSELILELEKLTEIKKDNPVVFERMENRLYFDHLLQKLRR